VINGFTQETSAEDCEYYGYHLYNALIRLRSLDDAIQDFLSNAQYYKDVEICEEYTDKAKRAILRASGELENRFLASAASTDIPDVNGRTRKRKATNLCFLCFNRGPNSCTCSKREVYNASTVRGIIP
jgi:hypothetical protein